jgi:hypothetical protein
MLGTGIHYPVMGRYLIRREDNPQDMCDREALANESLISAPDHLNEIKG